MSTWDHIQKNVRATGSFVGTSQNEQDAYFKFFALDRPRVFQPMKKAAQKLLQR